MEIKEIKINELNVPKIQVFEPLIPKIKKVPKLIIDYPACIKVHRNNLFTQIDIDENEEYAHKCNIKSVPTFYLHKGLEKIGETSGADITKIAKLIGDNIK